MLIDFVLGKNLHRRHLNTSQRTLVAAKLANLQNGSNQHKAKEGTQNCAPMSVEDAAKVLNVSPRSVTSGKQVLDGGSKELIAAVESCAVSARFRP